MNDVVCNVCQGKVERRLVTYSQFFEGRFVLIENVPASVCEQCGEVYYDPEIVDRIQHIVWSGGEPVRIVETPVYDLQLE